MKKQRVVLAAKLHRLQKDYKAVQERWGESASDAQGYKSKFGYSL